jgi:hypothetical protein
MKLFLKDYVQQKLRYPALDDLEISVTRKLSKKFISLFHQPAAVLRMVTDGVQCLCPADFV